MDKIKVIDARMGRGKTTAAIHYMQENAGRKRFLYVTPYLNEVDRICDACNFDQPESDHSTKLAELKHLLWQKKNIASTHALFYSLDEEALELIRNNKYSLIIDEAIDVIYRVQMTPKDRKIILEQMTETDDEGFVHWKDSEYTGKFDTYKEMADSNSLFLLDGRMMFVMNPDMLNAFSDVTMMTYLFGGQAQKAYLDYYGFEYEICGITNDDVPTFSDSPDAPPPIDYGSKIHIIDDYKLNAVGRERNSLSLAWYERHNSDSEEIKALRNHMNTFFRRRTHGMSAEQLWTCFKAHSKKLCGDRGRFAGSFLQISARATNEFRGRKYLAYMANRFIDPNISKFFAQRNIKIDADLFALSEMLQWIWRSCIRDGKPIELYIPSRRMRELLQNWIKEMNEGDLHNDNN